MSTIHSWSQIQSQLRNPENPVVFFDIKVGGTEIGRILLELYADEVPRTAENFRFFFVRIGGLLSLGHTIDQ